MRRRPERETRLRSFSATKPWIFSISSSIATSSVPSTIAAYCFPYCRRTKMNARSAARACGSFALSRRSRMSQTLLSAATAPLHRPIAADSILTDVGNVVERLQVRSRCSVARGRIGSVGAEFPCESARTLGLHEDEPRSLRDSRAINSLLFLIRRHRSSRVLVCFYQTRRNLWLFRQGLILCPLQSCVGRPFST